MQLALATLPKEERLKTVLRIRGDGSVHWYPIATACRHDWASRFLTYYHLTFLLPTALSTLHARCCFFPGLPSALDWS